MLRIGVLATLEGPYRVLGEDAMRGVNIALGENGGRIAGQPVELIVESTNAMAASATQACMALLNEANVDIILGPLSGDEGDAVREIAQQHPERAFVNGATASQQIYNPTPNFFSFSSNGVQNIAGLGRYCYEQGYRRVVTLSEAYSFTFAQVGGFALEFCDAGGEIVKMLWCGLGTEDFTSYIEQIPDDVDAICSVLGGTDCVRFIQQYRNLDGQVPLIGGSLQGDPTTLHFVRDYADLLVGVLTANPVCDDAPDENWRAFVREYQQRYAENGYYSPSIIALSYYTNMKALILALESVGGDIRKGQEDLKTALTTLEFDGLTHRVRLDRHNFPIIDNFVNEIASADDGTLYTRLVKRIENIDSTLGYSDEQWLAMGRFNQWNMPCSTSQTKKPTLDDVLKRRKNN